MSADIEKLERLACLKLSQEQKDNIAQSIEGVIETFNSVLNINCNENQNQNVLIGETRFRPENQGVEFDMSCEGLNIADEEHGYFLAPKVVKKD